MMKKGLTAIIIIFLALTTAQAQESEINEIRFLSDSWENVTNKDGTGLCWELFQKVYEPVGVKVTFDIVPYARSVRMVQDKQTDAAVGVYKDEFDKALFGKWHYLSDIVLVAFKKGKVENWEGEASLSGRIGWMRGYAFNEYLKENIKFDETDDRKAALKMLLMGRLDFFIDTEAELKAALETDAVNADDFQVETLLKLNVYLAFADTERGRRLMTIYDDRMAQLVASGELKPLYKKWQLTYPF